jgi:hypothetical protein
VKRTLFYNSAVDIKKHTAQETKKGPLGGSSKRALFYREMRAWG